MASSLFGKIARLATSPQGKRVINQAKDYASKPENRAKIEQARQKLVDRSGRRRSGPDTREPRNPDTSEPPAPKPPAPKS